MVSGIASYGNCFGVPNLGGETKFEPCYSQNPLVNAFALGLVRRDKIFYARASGEGNPVIYVGSKTGRDGIHGATMASEEFSETSEQKRPNVQVGDPFLEKLLLEACVEAMETGAVVGIQDMGAAGLTCSTCEMGARGHVGLEIELDLVPQRETGMTAYEIMLSESQERMLLVAEKGREEEVFAVFRKWGLDASTVGRVTSDGKMRVLHHGTGGRRNSQRRAHRRSARLQASAGALGCSRAARKAGAAFTLGAEADLTSNFERLLASPNICSTRWITEQYESYVQLVGTQRPGGDAGVLRVKGTERGLAMALDGNGRWCWLDPRLGAMHAVAEAARNVACAGARPIGATNCLNFGNPEKPHIMWQFSQVVDGMTKACEELETPITGGNVSFYNETLGEGIYPTPVVGIVGLIEHVDRAMTHDFREPGRAIVLLRGSEPGDAVDAEIEFGSSEYAKEIFGEVWGFPPALELEKEKALQDCIIDIVGLGLIDSAHDCSEGGLAVAVAESCFPREIGARLELKREDLGGDDLLPEYLLFGEDASRIVISCVRENVPMNQRSSGKIRCGRSPDRRHAIRKIRNSGGRSGGGVGAGVATERRLGARPGTRAAHRNRRAPGAGSFAEELTAHEEFATSSRSLRTDGWRWVTTKGSHRQFKHRGEAGASNNCGASIERHASEDFQQRCCDRRD